MVDIVGLKLAQNENLQAKLLGIAQLKLNETTTNIVCAIGTTLKSREV